jgi:hypothetical protein
MDDYVLRGVGYRLTVGVGSRLWGPLYWRAFSGWEQVRYHTVLTPPSSSSSSSSSSSPSEHEVTEVARPGVFITGAEFGVAF